MLSTLKRLAVASALMLALGLISGPNAFAQVVRTSGSGYVPVRATGRQCNDNSCGTRVVLGARLPAGSVVQAIRYYTTAGGPPGQRSKAHIFPLPA
jgi:hypothetical protein